MAAQPALQVEGIPSLHDSLISSQHSAVTSLVITRNSSAVRHDKCLYAHPDLAPAMHKREASTSACRAFVIASVPEYKNPPSTVHACSVGNTRAAQPALHVEGMPELQDSVASSQHSAVISSHATANSACDPQGIVIAPEWHGCSKSGSDRAGQPNCFSSSGPCSSGSSHTSLTNACSQACSKIALAKPAPGSIWGAQQTVQPR
eukprot:SAG31_NODE_4275_length_3387_cov_1.686740_2_plen_204_part_00